jgi:hypothetical protein
LSITNDIARILRDAARRVEKLSTSSSSSEPVELVVYPERPERKRQDGPKPGSQEWFKSLPPPRNDGVSMNSIARSVEKPKPPRRPGTQSTGERFNGWWRY